MNKRIIPILAFLLLLMLQCSYAFIQPLEMDQAYQLSGQITEDQRIAFSWKMAPNYYLYRDAFNFKVLKPSSLTLGEANYPKKTIEFEDILGTHDVYEKTVTITLPYRFNKTFDTPTVPTKIEVHYQGCTHNGFCYPPTNKTITLKLPTTPITNDAISIAPRITATNGVDALFTQKHILLVLLGFFGFGLLLTFTPCVLPMLPILSSIVLGKKELSTARSFSIALAYVLGMSLTFALAGVAAAMLGYSIQAYLQNAWIIIAVSILLLLLALSLLGCFQIHMPQGLQDFFDRLNQRQRSGTLVGAFIMGVLATLVVSPCVTPPLVGALTYIAHSGDKLLGASALFIMGWGMGIPLILVTTLGTRYIPKAGPWMNGVKNLMGILLLAVVILLITRILPGPIGLLLWAALLLVSALYLGLRNRAENAWQMLARAFALILTIYAVLLTVGAALKHDNPLHPLAQLSAVNQSKTTKVTPALNFKVVHNETDLQSALAKAKAQQHSVMVDFWAKWCLSCNIMDQTTFKDPKVLQALEGWDLIKVDITKNTEENRSVQKAYGIIAPPVLLFFDKIGNELTQHRLVGEATAKQLLKVIESLNYTYR